MKIANVSQANGASSCAPMAFNGRKKQLTKQIVGSAFEKVAQHWQGKLGTFYGTTNKGINVTIEISVYQQILLMYRYSKILVFCWWKSRTVFSYWRHRRYRVNCAIQIIVEMNRCNFSKLFLILYSYKETLPNSSGWPNHFVFFHHANIFLTR